MVSSPVFCCKKTCPIIKYPLASFCCFCNGLQTSFFV
jgi:hypothetical protein